MNTYLSPTRRLRVSVICVVVVVYHVTIVYICQVCELDIIFNFEKAYFMLDEFIIGGEVKEKLIFAGIVRIAWDRKHTD